MKAIKRDRGNATLGLTLSPGVAAAGSQNMRTISLEMRCGWFPPHCPIGLSAISDRLALRLAFR
jgi:hypothetical protein